MARQVARCDGRLVMALLNRFTQDWHTSRGRVRPSLPPDVNEACNHAGNVGAALVAGLIGYYMAQEGIFCLVVALSAATVLTVLLILRETSINDGHKDIVFMLFGGLVTGFSMVLSYFFGSSAGSAQKTVELAKIAKSR